METENSIKLDDSEITPLSKNTIHFPWQKIEKTSDSSLINNKLTVLTKCKGLLHYTFCEVNSEISEKIKEGDQVVIKCGEITDLAIVKITWEIVKFKRNLRLSKEILPVIIRKVNSDDLLTIEKNREVEEKAKEIFKEKIINYNLDMKLVQVHLQFDRRKLFFFYTSDGRVDFRKLARDLGVEFKVRVELRQIGLNEEIKRIGGLGTCGREFCCLSLFNKFKRKSNYFSFEKDLSSYFSKNSGHCGKNKCCLSFEMG